MMPAHTNGAAAKQKHTRKDPCPVCGGAESDPRSEGKRCHGFTSGDWVNCSRDDHAGSIEPNRGGLYGHLMLGSCKCGETHGLSRVRASTGATKSGLGTIVVAWNYTDKRGALVFQVVKFHPKTFRQRRPDGAGGWTWNLEGVSKVLYRLPDLIGADVDRVVYIVEGEKDVETLMARGLLATCNPMGAGKWHFVANHACEVLRNRDVVIISDRDPPLDEKGRPHLKGQRHARDVAASLEGHARSVSVRIPRAPGRRSRSATTAASAFGRSASAP